MEHTLKMVQQFEEEISQLEQKGIVGISFENEGGVDFDVVLGTNGLYYIGKKGEHECFNNCKSEEECICYFQFPNSVAFFTPKEVANYIVLNFHDKQNQL